MSDALEWRQIKFWLEFFDEINYFACGLKAIFAPPCESLIKGEKSKSYFAKKKKKESFNS